MLSKTIKPVSWSALPIAAFACLLFLSASPSASAQTQVTVSPQTRHQTMDGFGSALSWYTNRVYKGDAANDAAIEQLMFEDLGLDILRLKNWYFPNDTDANNAMNSHARNETFYNAAKAANPDIQILLSSWSPPESLKSTGDRKGGGTLASDADGFMYDELAQYWVDLLDAQSWSPDYLSFQNEPGYTATWESCVFKGTETASLPGYGEAADAIWNAIKDRPDVPKMLGSEAENLNVFSEYNNEVRDRDYFDVHGYHIYNFGTGTIDTGAINQLNGIRDNYGDRPNWMTEFSAGWDWMQAARIMHNTVVEANASGYIYWKLIWGTNNDGAGNPIPTEDSMLDLHDDGSYTVKPHYYTVKHFSKHVDQGYDRIEIGGTTTNIKVSGYLSEDRNSITLVAINQTAVSDSIALTHQGYSTTAIEGYQSVVDNYYQTMTGLDAANPITLPAESITTLVLTLSEPYNTPPVADDLSATVGFNTALPITLPATDSPGESLTYTIVSNPSNGTLSGTAPDLTYTPNTDYTGTDSFTFKVNDGQVDSNTATVSISVNTPPVADAQSVSVFYNTDESFTLSGSDANGESLTYTVVSNPSNGSLSGTAPNLTYTPGADYSGADSFTFKVNDGIDDSNTATVSITVSSSSNTAPEVSAGTDASASLSGTETVDPTAGAEIFLDAAQDPDSGVNGTWEDTLSAWDLTLDTANGVTYDSNPGSSLSGITSAYDFPGGESGAGGASTSEHFKTMGWQTTPVSIEIWFKPDSTADDGKTNGQVLFETGGSNGMGIFYNDGFIEVGSDTTEVISVDASSLTDEFIQAVLTYDIGGTNDFVLYLNGAEAATGNRADAEWSGANGSGLAAKSDTNVGGRGDGDSGTESFEGKIAIFRAYENQVLTGGEVLANYQSIDGSAATVSLNGSASDVDGQNLTTTWSLVSGPGAVIFADASALGTTASFALDGDYVLRLTVDDGYDQNSSDVTITVTLSGASFTATYDGNGADSGDAPTDGNSPYAADATVTVLGNTGALVKSGFYFDGWNTASDGTGTSYNATDTFTITENVTLYAQWTPNTPVQNLVANGGFEGGYDSGWSHGFGNGAAVNFSEETTDVQEGAKALSAVVTTAGANAWDVQTLGPNLLLSVGEEYTLTFWAKAANAGESFRTVLQNGIYTARDHYLTTDWQQYSWTFTAQESSPQIRLHFPQAGGFLIDDFQLVEPAIIGNVQVGIAPQTKHQEMVGFGAALSWYTNWVYGGDAANDAALEQLMFEDLGMDVLRLKNWYYPVDYPATTSPTNLSTQQAFDQTADFFNAAKAANPDIQVLFSSWSPPASLKSNGERNNGGTLKSDADGYMYDELAQYWVDLLDNLGWTPDYLSFQNEPGYVAPWESCILRPTETAENAGYAEAADAIWNAIKDRPNVPAMLGSEAENIGSATWSDWNGGASVNTFEALNTPLLSRPYFAAHGYHTYNIYSESGIDDATSISRLNMVRDSFGDRPNWMTEWSKAGIDWFDTARVVHNTVVEANASAYIFWKLAWSVGESTDTMIAVDQDGTYEIRPHYYTIKHYSKFVDKGDKRIEITSGDEHVKVSGYLSADATRITLVALNKYPTSRDIELSHDALPISAIAGYQSVADNYYQTMTGLDAAAPVTLPGKSMTTLVLTLSESLNVAPVADNLSETTEFNTALPITLSADDLEGDPLTYSIVSGPTSGTLSGTLPNLTYTPNAVFSGSDSFTYKANDGYADSNIATVSITVTESYSVTYDPNSADSGVVPTDSSNPYASGATVTALGNTGALAKNGFTFDGWNTASGGSGTSYSVSDNFTITQDITLYAKWVAAASTPNLVFNGDFEAGYANGWNHRDADNGGSAIFSEETIDIQEGSKALKVEVNTLGGNPWNVQSLGPNLNLTTGDEYTLTFWAKAASESTTIKMVFQNTQYDGHNYTLGTNWMPYSATITAKEDSPEIKLQFPDLGTVWVDDIRVTYNNTLPHVFAGFDATAALPASTSETTVVLSGAASDADGHSLTNNWSVSSAPTAVTFADASSPETTATFTQAGSYVLRLTATDGYDSSFDEVEIVILEDTDSDGMPDTWESVHGFSLSTSSADMDSDYDGATDFEEYLAGTDPTDPTKHLKLISLTFSESDARILTWSSDQDGTTRERLYDLQRNTTLSTEGWVNVWTNIPPDGATTQRIDSDEIMSERMFYRLLIR